jgi:hypothetical protein
MASTPSQVVNPVAGPSGVSATPSVDDSAPVAAPAVTAPDNSTELTQTSCAPSQPSLTEAGSELVVTDTAPVAGSSTNLGNSLVPTNLDLATATIAPATTSDSVATFPASIVTNVVSMNGPVYEWNQPVSRKFLSVNLKV